MEQGLEQGQQKGKQDLVKQFLASKEIHAEIYHTDLSFIPSPTATSKGFQKLGRLGQMVKTICLVEYFWKPPTLAEVRNGLLKLFSWHGQLQRDAKSKKRRLAETDLPRLWIITTTMPNCLPSKSSLTLDLPNWGAGIYFQEELLKTAVVAIDRIAPGT